ncbi:3' terminal RNA ribose 2'-O-methyltransferase Hen1 [Chamaesiphon minutus]|uniref:Small RNA 2'-O-methyltransferase n=1 Tax=Chamaesiphon minutus (strain ATCC 27169 / PCC 6605) TaxID=1173020 RepID=K9UEZ7_CHAP6|nr:3' terminal RNA ribose 2'-O-methyltransferase Hen1 [Chamaesiphon minutus]AFY93697.1 3' terminal RNA ribose 2'-O-methyltransferase Hen1 [Chamaesiphon minutus PCC 6605]
MLLTISTTHQPATDLGYLLFKHPDKCQEFNLSFGTARVFYPEASDTKCTAALVLDINPVDLARGKAGAKRQTLEAYVSDRPYAASSFLSVAISQVFRTAMTGRCEQKQAVADTPIPLVVKIPVLPSRGREGFLRGLFEPLGYDVSVRRLALDETFPDWGNSSYFDVELSHTIKLCDLLSHLHVMIPVLDDDKHYYVNEDEIEKLLRHGEGWLSTHPLKEEITSRYLKRQRGLTRDALAQIAVEEVIEETSDLETQEEIIEKPISLNQQRMETVVAALKANGVQKIVDLGCGEGKLLKLLLKEPTFQEILGMDVTYKSLEFAQERVLDKLPTHQKGRLQLIQGSLNYRDARITGYDAATVIEVIEHMELDRLIAFERVLFEFAKPKIAIVTTPNVEYNVKFENLPTGKLRHPDHRFEWTRVEFKTWAQSVGDRYKYSLEFSSIGDVDPVVGSPTQMAMFIATV